MEDESCSKLSWHSRAMSLRSTSSTANQNAGALLRVWARLRPLGTIERTWEESETPTDTGPWPHGRLDLGLGYQLQMHSHVIVA